MGPRVLKFDCPSGRGLWYRRFAAMSIYARLRRENHKTAPSCGREYSLSTLWPAPLSEANTTLLYNLRQSRAPSQVQEYR